MQAVARYRDEYRHGFLACPTPKHADEVVICSNGRGGSADRLPLPDERDPPQWARRATGDIPSASAAGAGGGCNSSHCAVSGAIDLVAAGAGLVQVARAIVDPEGASDYADRHPR